MCDPISITSAALTIGGEIVRSNDQNRVDKKNRSAARTALRLENRDISIRALQERVAAAQETVLANAEAAEASGLTAVSAAGGNVGGMTVDLLLADIESTRLAEVGRIATQRDDILGSLDRERAGAAVAARNRANQTAPANPFASILRIGSGTVDAYAGYKSRQPPVTPRSP